MLNDTLLRGRAAAILVSLAIVLFCPVGLAVAQEGPPAASASDPRAALAEILRDDESRAALIAELVRLSGEAGAEPEPVSVVRPLPGRQLANTTQAVVENLAVQAAELWDAIQRAPQALDNIGAREIAVLLAALQDLLLVIASTVLAFLVLRWLSRFVYGQMGRRARHASVLARWIILFVSGVVDAAVVILSWAIGYVLAVSVIGQFGEIAIRQSLYLNAFVIVELVKVAVRLVISPAAHDLRPLALSDQGARRLYHTMNVAISLIGYGLLLVVPIINTNASFAAGRSASMIVILLAALYLAVMTLRHRHAVEAWLLLQGRTPVPDAAQHEAGAEMTAPDIAQTPSVVPVTGPVVAPEVTPDTIAPDDAASGEASPQPVVVEVTGAGTHLAREPRRRSVYALLARNWHVLMLLWLGFVLVTVLTRPVAQVFDVIRNSGIVVLIVLGGVALSGAIARAIGRGVTLPAHVNARLPRLETRLNGFVPQLLTMLRVLLLVVVVALVIDVAGLVGVREWATSPTGLSAIGALVSVAITLLLAFVLWLALTSWVEYRLNPEFSRVPTSREQTLLTLLRNALTVVLLVITLMVTLSELGLNIGPLLASAGVLGLAIGFGAQKLVQDVITGVFIQFENAMNVGDVVTAGPVTGLVEKLTIRSVSLRDFQGVYHLIPFSSVDAVSNFTRDFSQYVLDMGIAYREDIGEAKQAMFDAFDELRRDPEHGPSLMGDLEWFGLDRFGDSAIVLRARIKTLPGKQWGIGRAYNGIVKRIFDERGIEIPFPHTTLYFGENKAGETQRLRVTTPPGGGTSDLPAGDGGGRSPEDS